MMLTPERWQFDANNVLTFIISLNAERNAKFEQFLERHLPEDKYFPVRFLGINYQSLWRFGRCLWERQADGATRHRIVLVPEGYDDERGGTGQFLLLEPEMTMLKQAAVLTKLRVNALIDELNHAGLIDDETRDRINAKPSVLPFNQMRVFDHAVNVGDHFD